MNTQKMSISLPKNMVEEIEKMSRNENVSKSAILKQSFELWRQNQIEKDLKRVANLKLKDVPDSDWERVQWECYDY